MLVTDVPNVVSIMVYILNLDKICLGTFVQEKEVVISYLVIKRLTSGVYVLAPPSNVLSDVIAEVQLVHLRGC